MTHFNQHEDFFLSNVFSDNNYGSGTWDHIFASHSFGIRFVISSVKMADVAFIHRYFSEGIGLFNIGTK